MTTVSATLQGAPSSTLPLGYGGDFSSYDGISFMLALFMNMTRQPVCNISGAVGEKPIEGQSNSCCKLQRWTISGKKEKEKDVPRVILRLKTDSRVGCMCTEEGWCT